MWKFFTVISNSKPGRQWLIFATTCCDFNDAFLVICLFFFFIDFTRRIQQSNESDKFSLNSRVRKNYLFTWAEL